MIKKKLKGAIPFDIVQSCLREMILRTDDEYEFDRSLKSKAGRGSDANTSLYYVDELYRYRIYHEPYGGDERPFLDGDFVCYFPACSAYMLRGTIALNDTYSPRFMFTSDDQTVHQIVTKEEICPDYYPTRQRFQEGEQVLLHRSTAHPGWVVARVDCEWPKPNRSRYPRFFNDPMPFYQFRTPVGTTIIHGDERRNILPFPIPGFCRFQSGDEVTFNADKADEKDQCYLKGGWMAGKITEVNPSVDQKDENDVSYKVYNGQYECTFLHKGKEARCLIMQDDDEHVSNNADPRARLSDTIEQNCSIHHIDYLVKEFNIDVASFQDVFLSEAVKYANYDALWWLQDNLHINLHALRDENGRCIMYQLAESQDVIRFMERLVEIESLENDDRPDSYIRDAVYFVAGQKDAEDPPDEESFLSVLMRRRYIHALDYALSPRTGMGWIIASLPNEYITKELLKLRSVAEENEMSDVIYMVDKFIAFHKTYVQVLQMQLGYHLLVTKQFQVLKVRVPPQK